ncbi:lipoprotein ABC transporter permease [Alkalispirochaeta sphaeroplastigenens]|uniref:Lipoprotein ABC transporter permease n=1 Tax=Alkalispirochaeta sphaeroplastigenens TaxID=1187066 RepID=A0A2S4JJU3_9SPIO|nr:FtsX-like permease family protein [Alkalispirochaeta sphaeroplastigenens]POQ99689.1 lipoprotein ABC transporter permease [Alkalispirochaeta sphaeroplastigenens]
MARNIITLATRNILRNRRRSALSVTAIALAACTITLLFALLEGIRADVRHNSWNYETGEVRLRHALFDRYEHLNPLHYTVAEADLLLPALRSLDQTHRVSPRVHIQGATFRGEEMIPSRGIGIDLDREGEDLDLERLLLSGRLPRPGTSEALVGAGLAEKLGLSPGEPFTVLTTTRLRSSNAFTLDVTGLVAFPLGHMNQTSYLLPLETAGRYLRMEGGVSEILISGTGSDTPGLVRAVEEVLQAQGLDQLRPLPWTEVSGGYRYLQVADIIYRIIALCFFLVGSSVIVNTTMMTIHERTREIGTLSALGMSEGTLVRLFFTEASLLGTLGSLAGVLAGSLLILPAQIGGIDFGSRLDMVEIDISSVIHPLLNLQSTLGVFCYSLAVALAASYLPARRAAGLPPVEALRA